MKNLVVDQEQFNQFVNDVLPPLKPGELYFVSLSARNKYLSADERLEYNLGRTEMFGRTLSSGDWDYTMKKLSSVLDYRTTKNGLPYPEHALVVYVNINPVNSVKACANFAKVVNNIQAEMLNAYMNGKVPNEEQMIRGDRLLMNEYQKATGTRHLVDIDCDCSKELAEELNDVLLQNNVSFWVVETHGGYHFLVNRESLNKAKFPLHETVNKLHKEALKSGGEVMFNSNGMVSMPGTLHGGKQVRLYQTVVK